VETNQNCINEEIKNHFRIFRLPGSSLRTLEIKIYKTIILPAVLSLTLRGERRLRVFEKWEEVAGGWRKLLNEELHNLGAR
jgi:hypothetical protein